MNNNDTNQDAVPANLVSPHATVNQTTEHIESDTDDSTTENTLKRRSSAKKDLFGGKKKKAALPKKSTKAIELTHVVPVGLNNPVHGFCITMEGDGEKFLSAVIFNKEKKAKKEAFIEDTQIINWTFNPLDANGQPQKNLKNYNKKGFVVIFPKDTDIAKKQDLLEWIKFNWVEAIENLHEGKFTEATKIDPEGQGDEWYFKVDSWSKIVSTDDIIKILQRDTVKENGFSSAEKFFATPGSMDAVYSCWKEGEVPKQAVKQLKFSVECLRESDKHLVEDVKQDQIEEEAAAKRYEEEQKKLRRDNKRIRRGTKSSVRSDTDTILFTKKRLIQKCLTSYFKYTQKKKNSSANDDQKESSANNNKKPPSRQNSTQSEENSNEDK